jgi:hypothetical protein
MLLMWDKYGTEDYILLRRFMLSSNNKLFFLVVFLAHVKFEVVKTLIDRSCLSEIAPDGVSRKKGAKRILVHIFRFTLLNMLLRRMLL